MGALAAVRGSNKSRRLRVCPSQASSALPFPLLVFKANVPEKDVLLSKRGLLPEIEMDRGPHTSVAARVVVASQRRHVLL